MKVNKKRFLLFGIVIFLMYLMTSFVSAELNLVISANEKGEVSDFYAQTNPNADESYDAYDLEYPPFPVSLPKIYSVVDGKKMIMDSWLNSDRTLKLIYEKANDSLVDMDFSFSGEISGTYKLTLRDYGDDLSYTNLVGSTSMEEGKVYSTKISSEKTYFELEVDYLYCGDGICSKEEDESCSSCSNDCGNCKGDEDITFNLNDDLSPFYLMSVSDLENGFSRLYNLDTGFKLHYANVTHTLKVSSISESSKNVVISSDMLYLEINENDDCAGDPFGTERGLRQSHHQSG